MKSINGERIFVRHRTPGVTEGMARRRQKLIKNTRLNNQTEEDTIIDIKTQKGEADLKTEQDTADHTASHGPYTINSHSTNLRPNPQFQNNLASYKTVSIRGNFTPLPVSGSRTQQNFTYDVEKEILAVSFPQSYKYKVLEKEAQKMIKKNGKDKSRGFAIRNGVSASIKRTH